MPLYHEWTGTVLTITSDSGTSSCDLKGEKGDDGCRGPQGRTGLTIGNDGIIDTSGLATTDYVDYKLKDITVSGFSDEIITEASGAIVNVADAAKDTCRSLVSTIEPAQAGSGDASPTNVRTISGWDAVEATRTGKNILSCKDKPTLPRTIRGITFEDAGNGKIRVSGTSTGVAALYLDTYQINQRTYIPAGTYTFSGIIANSGARMYFHGFNEQSTPTDSDFIRESISGATTSKTITFEKGGYYSYYISIPTGTTLDTIVSPQIEAGTAATAYEPYEAQTITTNLPETVYGGSLDWATGVLTVDRFIKILDGTEIWVLQTVPLEGASSYFIKLSDNKMPALKNVNVMSSHFVSKTAGQSGTTMNAISGNNTKINIIVNVDSTVCGSTINEFKSYLSAQKTTGTPVVISYEMAEPYTIQLTPQQLLTLKKGINNVWSDSGETAIEYKADTKLYIDGKFTELTNAIISLGGNV